MQTIDELSQQIKLSEDQSKAVKLYIGSLVLDLLESLKQDNLKNFDETIESLGKINS